MESFFSEEQLNNMSRENLIELMKIMKAQAVKKDMEIQLLKDKYKELEFMNALLSDRLALAQRKQFGSSSEKYAEGYEQLELFNEAETSADPETAEPSFEEIHPSSYKRKKRTGKKEEDLSGFEITETAEYALAGEDRYCPDCGKKYKVVTKETVKRLKFVPARFEVVEEVTYVYSCPECGSMKRPEKIPPLIKGSIATPSLIAGIMKCNRKPSTAPCGRKGGISMDCTEAYKEHILYSFNGFCKVVIRYAAINAWRDRNRRRQKEISFEYLTEEKFYHLSTSDEYLKSPYEQSPLQSAVRQSYSPTASLLQPCCLCRRKRGKSFTFTFSGITHSRKSEIYTGIVKVRHGITYTVPCRCCRRKWRCFCVGNPKLIPYETIVRATSGEPEAVEECSCTVKKQATENNR